MSLPRQPTCGRRASDRAASTQSGCCSRLAAHWSAVPGLNSGLPSGLALPEIQIRRAASSTAITLPAGPGEGAGFCRTDVLLVLSAARRGYSSRSIAHQSTREQQVERWGLCLCVSASGCVIVFHPAWPYKENSLRRRLQTVLVRQRPGTTHRARASPRRINDPDRRAGGGSGSRYSASAGRN